MTGDFAAPVGPANHHPAGFPLAAVGTDRRGRRERCPRFEPYPFRGNPPEPPPTQIRSS